MPAATRTHRTASDETYWVADAVPHLVWVARPDGEPEYLNRACLDYHGLPLDDLIGTGWRAVVHPDDLPAAAALWEAAVRDGTEFRSEHRLLRYDGEYRWHLVTARPQRGARGEVARWFGTCTDVYDRKAAEDALRRSEARFRAIIEKSFEAVELIAADGTIVYASPSVVRTGGRGPEELVGRSAFEWCHPDDAAELAANYVSFLARPGASLGGSYRYRHKDGSWRWAEATCTNLLHDPDVGAVVVNFHDVTDRVEAERALREREALLQGIIAHIPCRVFWKDRTSVYLGCNDLFAQDHGLPGPGAVVGRSDHDLGTPPEQAEGFRASDRRVMETGEPLVNVEEALTLPGGALTLLTSKVPLRDARGAVVGVLGVYQDITGRKRLEEQLRHSQKMEAVGRLAGGVAHDFNNLLTVINGYADVIAAGLPEHGPARPMVEEVRKAGERAAALTRQLLAFGRKQLLHRRVLDLNAVVGDLARMLRRLIGEDVELVVRPGERLLRVKADPGQVEQVLLNLAVNARDAMPDGGTLAIETRNVALLGGVADDGADIRPGPYVLVSMSDTGCGMTEEVRAHIFEPFFTTKGPGKGTGLGLPMVYGIVKQSGGHVEVETAPGRGTTFRVYLPGVAAPGAGERPLGAGALPRGTEAVLVAEDEDGVRRLAELALRQLGYTVFTAAGPDEAAEVARSAGPIDLLLTDVVMPGGGGRELAERLRASRPGLRVLYMSGYPADAIVRHGVEHDRFDLLPKPFTPAALARKVREVLDRPRGAPAPVL